MALTKIGASLGGGADTIFVTQAGHGLTLGYPVKASGNGTYAHATADTAANAEAIGIIIESTTDTMLIALSGRITVDGVVPNLSAGTVLFLQVSAGLLAAAEPSGNTQVSKPMAVITYANSEMILLAHRGEVISTAGITLADGSVDNDAMADDAIGVAELSATGTASSSTFLRGDNAWTAAGVSVKVGHFTRDTATASGNQAITGVGFTPKALLFIGGQNQTTEINWGVSDGSTEYSLADRYGNADNTYGISTSRWGTFIQTGSLEYTGTVASLDADGFSITWTRISTPTGTLSLSYLAIG